MRRSRLELDTEGSVQLPLKGAALYHLVLSLTGYSHRYVVKCPSCVWSVTTSSSFNWLPLSWGGKWWITAGSWMLGYSLPGIREGGNQRCWFGSSLVTFIMFSSSLRVQGIHRERGTSMNSLFALQDSGKCFVLISGLCAYSLYCALILCVCLYSLIFLFYGFTRFLFYDFC